MIQYHDSSAYYSEKQYRSFCITFLQTTSAYRGVCDLRKFCKEQFIQLKNIKSKKETWSWSGINQESRAPLPISL
jgi:hypothetical protein